MTIQVRYSCGACGIEKQALDVRTRAGGEELISWMDATMFSVHDDHLARSPRCPSQYINLMVPVADGRPVGGEAVH